MSHHQSEKSSYPSIYSPGKFITFAQYVAELMCGRRAKFEHTDLPAKFWESSPKWKAYFTFQVLWANKLLKKYNEHVILASLKEMPYVFSLRLKPLNEKFEEVNKRMLSEVKKADLDIKVTNEVSTGRFNRKNKLSNLDE